MGHAVDVETNFKERVLICRLNEWCAVSRQKASSQKNASSSSSCSLLTVWSSTLWTKTGHLPDRNMWI